MFRSLVLSLKAKERFRKIMSQRNQTEYFYCYFRMLLTRPIKTEAVHVSHFCCVWNYQYLDINWMCSVSSGHYTEI